MASKLITSRSEIPDAPLYVLSNDAFMGHWGMSRGKINTVILPCESWAEAQAVAKYADSRPEQKRVRIVMNKPRLRVGTHTYSLMSRETATAWYPEK
jgi:hypothetical protein